MEVKNGRRKKRETKEWILGGNLSVKWD